LVWLAYSMGLTSTFVEKLQAGRQMIEQFRQVPWLVLVLGLAIVPAICEEWFFRGFVLSALLVEATPRKAILVSAFLFGMFHVVGASLAAERFLPSTLMGLILGWVCWRSGSVLPGMLLHAVHNAILLSIGYYEVPLRQSGWLHLDPGQLTILGTVSVLAAFVAWRILAGRQVGNDARSDSPGTFSDSTT
jgi:ABC-2 type transport system permease protein/sodium transport system permease protein